MFALTLVTPLYHRPTQIHPTQKNICVGMASTHKDLCGDIPTHSPHKIFHFFVPTEKFASSPRNPHASLNIPIHPQAPFLHGNMWEFAIYIEYLLSPRKISSFSRPHTNCSDWYPSPRKISSFRGSVRQGCSDARWYFGSELTVMAIN